MNRVVHFEINVADPERAAAFYRDVFGWEITRWGEHEYWLVSTGDPGRSGIDGAIVPARNGAPGTINTVQVESVAEVARAVEAAGGRVTMPETPIPGVGTVIYCTDPAGTTFGALQPE